jgi:hypothetical protein
MVVLTKWDVQKLIAYCWPMVVPESSLLAVKHLALQFVPLFVHPEKPDMSSK